MSKTELLKKDEWVEAGGLDDYLNIKGYFIIGNGVKCPRCNRYDTEELFKENRYNKPEDLSAIDKEHLYQYTWIYYECNHCHLVFIERQIDDSSIETEKEKNPMEQAIERMKNRDE